MILKKLKESTRSQHEALESIVDVMNRTLSMDDYTDLLLKFYTFYSTVEPRLPADELLKAGFDVGERSKTAMLDRDLKHLGAPIESGNWDGAPNTRNAAEAFGAIYVMEGATLGGQLITRHLKEHLGLSPESGGAFFNSYGADVGRKWKEFGRIVTAYSEENPGEDEAIVRSARDTFDSFRSCFESHRAAEPSVV